MNGETRPVSGQTSKKIQAQPENYIGKIVFKLLTLSYSAAFNYNTLDPITYIKDNQDYQTRRDRVTKALAQFRRVKAEELAFVQRAVSGVPRSP